MSQFVQSGSSMQPRMSVIVPATSFVGLVNGNAYAVGTDGTLLNTGQASLFAVPAASFGPLLKPPYLLDLGADQPRGLLYGCDTLLGSTVLTGLVGGTYTLNGIDGGLLPGFGATNTTISPWFNAAATSPFAAGAVSYNWTPSSLTGSTVLNQGANTQVIFPRFAILTVVATTWPSPASGSVLFKIYS